MKAWKIMAFSGAGLIALTFIISLICRTAVTDAGLRGIRTVEEYLSYCSGVSVRAVDGVDDNGETADNLLSDKDYFKTSVSSQGAYVHHDLQVFVVEMEDKEIEEEETAFQRGSTIAQSVRVIKVLQGDSIEGEYIELYSMFGLSISEDGSVINMGSCWKNIMLPGNQYLVFCEAMENMEELEDYCGAALKYRTVYSLFNQLNITKDMTLLLNEDGTCDNWKEIEFFAYNQTTLDALLEIKHEILDAYDLSVGDWLEYTE